MASHRRGEHHGEEEAITANEARNPPPAASPPAGSLIPPCGGSNPRKLVGLLLPPRRPDRALPLADFPQPPRGLGVLCLGVRWDLLLIEKVCTAHIRDVWRGGKPHKSFCALLRAA